jgi:hypothetical protein
LSALYFLHQTDIIDVQGGYATMARTLDNRLNDLIHEIKEIKKQIILGKIERVGAGKNKINRWKTIGDEVTSKWNGLSAVEEITQQREKIR